jgi:hypothetical protein
METKRQRNFFIPYIKGWAIISIMLIHLVDWSNVPVAGIGGSLKELLYPAVLFFIANAGSVIYVAYNHYELPKATKKLFRRGGELILIYFLYNVIKFFIFDFTTEPFYDKFQLAHIHDIGGIFTFHSFTAPISILFTIGVLLLIAPVLLYISKKSAYPKTMIALLLVSLGVANWLFPHPIDPITRFLYAEGNVTFPIALWLIPFILGFLVAQFEFEKYATEFFVLFAVGTAFFAILLPETLNSFRPSWNMYPLTLYYIALSFTLMYLLIIIFKKLEKITLLKKFLALVRFWGDSTLSIYVYHWILIDLTLWLFYPSAWSIWITVPVFLIGYTYMYREKLSLYFDGIF